eukprot:GEMP01147861.1.p1 GENE.GEMP01147861.1~~GEMP01147861.1.p1  ORF type:complete len:110 (-),score=4.98 GEMP01147861.1:81-410(-)
MPQSQFFFVTQQKKCFFRHSFLKRDFFGGGFIFFCGLFFKKLYIENSCVFLFQFHQITAYLYTYKSLKRKKLDPQEKQDVFLVVQNGFHRKKLRTIWRSTSCKLSTKRI